MSDFYFFYSSLLYILCLTGTFLRSYFSVGWVPKSTQFGIVGAEVCTAGLMPFLTPSQQHLSCCSFYILVF